MSKGLSTKILSVVAVAALALGITGVILAVNNDSTDLDNIADKDHISELRQRLQAIPHAEFNEVDGLMSLKITNDESDKLSGRAVAVVCGLRANDFDGIELCHEMVARNELNGVNFEIFPVVNYQGYQYAKSTDQSWTKNRNLNNCEGVNLERNFNSNFQVLDCDDPNYGGTSAESEKEIHALVKQLDKSKYKAVFSVESGLDSLTTASYRNSNAFRQMGKLNDINFHLEL